MSNSNQNNSLKKRIKDGSVINGLLGHSSTKDCQKCKHHAHMTCSIGYLRRCSNDCGKWEHFDCKNYKDVPKRIHLKPCTSCKKAPEEDTKEKTKKMMKLDTEDYDKETTVKEEVKPSELLDKFAEESKPSESTEKEVEVNIQSSRIDNIDLLKQFELLKEEHKQEMKLLRSQFRKYMEEEIPKRVNIEVQVLKRLEEMKQNEFN